MDDPDAYMWHSLLPDWMFLGFIFIVVGVSVVWHVALVVVKIIRGKDD